MSKKEGSALRARFLLRAFELLLCTKFNFTKVRIFWELVCRLLHRLGTKFSSPVCQLFFGPMPIRVMRVWTSESNDYHHWVLMFFWRWVKITVASGGCSCSSAWCCFHRRRWAPVAVCGWCHCTILGYQICCRSSLRDPIVPQMNMTDKECSTFCHELAWPFIYHRRHPPHLAAARRYGRQYTSRLLHTSKVGQVIVACKVQASRERDKSRMLGNQLWKRCMSLIN